MPRRTTKDDGPHNVDVHVGRKMRTARMIEGVSQEELGEGLGVTFQQVQKYEKGSNRISASKLWETSEVLRVPIDFFFEDLKVDNRGGKSDVEMVADFTSSRDGMSIIRAFNQIENPNVRGKFVQLLQALAGQG
jgi:transcriptional regulator with XRE-family HTH domain